MFNQTWLLIAFTALLIGLAAGRPGLAVLGTILVSAIGVAWAWNHWALSGVEYRRRLSERRAFPGETIVLELSVANRKVLPLSWLRIEDECPPGLTVLDGEHLPSSQGSGALLANVLALRWFQRVRWRIRLRPGVRGVYHLGPARLASGDIFGLFRRDLTLETHDTLIVYPRVYTLEALGLPSKEPFGDSPSSLRMLEDPSRTVGIRDYGAGDPLRRVHWKATARRQQLQVRVYEPSTHLELLICLNVVTLPYGWQGSIPELLEHTISVAASLAAYGVEHRYEVGLIANGCWPLSDQPLKVLPGRSPYHLVHLLEALAAVLPLPTERLPELLLRSSARLPWGATLAVVTAIVDDDLVQAMLRLRSRGRRLVLFSLDTRPESPAIPAGILSYRIASQPGEAPIRFAQTEATA